MGAARRATNGVKPTFDDPTRCPCWTKLALEVAKRCPACPRPATDLHFTCYWRGWQAGQNPGGWRRGTLLIRREAG